MTPAARAPSTTTASACVGQLPVSVRESALKSPPNACALAAIACVAIWVWQRMGCPAPQPVTASGRGRHAGLSSSLTQPPCPVSGFGGHGFSHAHHARMVSRCACSSAAIVVLPTVTGARDETADHMLRGKLPLPASWYSTRPGAARSVKREGPRWAISYRSAHRAGTQYSACVPWRSSRAQIQRRLAALRKVHSSGRYRCPRPRSSAGAGC